MNEKERPPSQLPECVKLYAEGTTANDPKVRQGFVDRFVEVWQILPAEDREAMERYFEANKGQLNVQLRDHHHNLTRGPSGDASAQYNYVLGAEIIYKSFIAKNLKNASCRYWIAHEIAHFFLHLHDDAHGTVYEVAEKQVEELLEHRWGFAKGSESDLAVEMYFINAGDQIDGNLVML
jgi:hypothetical protein